MKFFQLLCLVVVGYCLMQCCNAEILHATGYKGKSLGMQCKHNIPQQSIKAISWHFNKEKDFLIQYNAGEQYPVEVKSDNYRDRVNIAFPAGDLTVKPLKWSDRGRYTCVVVTTGGGAEDASKYDIHVHVEPENLQTKCSIKSSDSYSTPTEVCATTNPSEGINVDSISCSVTAYPKATITWEESPADCEEKDIRQCNTQKDEPENCASQLTNLCEGKYKCAVRYVDGNVSMTVKGEAVFVQFSAVNGDGPNTKPIHDGDGQSNGDHDSDSVSRWKLIVGLLVGLVLLVVFVISGVFYCRLSKRFKDPNNARDANDPSCLKVVLCPCLVPKSTDINLAFPVQSSYTTEDNNYRRKEDEEPLKENGRECEYHSDEDSPPTSSSNPYNSISRRKKVRPEILQAVQAAKALMSTPEADKVNFMVQTIGGTKYKFEVEKGNKGSSTENLANAGDTSNDRDDEFLSIKGPTTEKKPTVDVDDVD